MLKILVPNDINIITIFFSTLPSYCVTEIALQQWVSGDPSGSLSPAACRRTAWLARPHRGRWAVSLVQPCIALGTCPFASFLVPPGHSHRSRGARLDNRFPCSLQDSCPGGQAGSRSLRPWLSVPAPCGPPSGVCSNPECWIVCQWLYCSFLSLRNRFVSRKIRGILNFAPCTCST